MATTQETGAVAVQVQEGVGILTFADADKMNAFDPKVLAELSSAVHGLLADDRVRAVVLTGSGRAFSTGADVRAMHEAAKGGDAAQWVLDATHALHPLLVAIHGSPKPFLAAVNGVAAGGGLGLALACDGRIGAPEARFAAGYFGIGLCPDGGATWFLPRLMGLQRTRRFFMDNEVMGADEALRVGLLDRIVPADALLEETVGQARRWGAWSRHSTWATKRLLAATTGTGLQEQLDAERGMIAAAAARDDFKEGTLAFMERRAARFG